MLNVKRKLTSKQGIIVKIILMVVMMIAPIADGFNYFSVYLYILSFLCLAGKYVVELFVEIQPKKRE